MAQVVPPMAGSGLLEASAESSKEGAVEGVGGLERGLLGQGKCVLCGVSQCYRCGEDRVESGEWRVEKLVIVL